eukprot:COSAG04_NODE_17504_length_467_cov_2.073370_1_plen_38_part_01
MEHVFEEDGVSTRHSDGGGGGFDGVQRGSVGSGGGGSV